MNYGLHEVKDAEGKTHIEATEETFEYFIETEAHIRRLEAAPFWD